MRRVALHYHAEEIDNGFVSHPLGVAWTPVGLNPTASDPWRRTLPAWGLREGFFVLPEPGGVPALLAGAAALAWLGRRRARLLPCPQSRSPHSLQSPSR